MWPMLDTLGSVCERVKSDMTYYETVAGVGVFVVGSINRYSSLGSDGYWHSVAKVTENVLGDFI